MGHAIESIKDLSFWLLTPPRHPSSLQPRQNQRQNVIPSHTVATLQTPIVFHTKRSIALLCFQWPDASCRLRCTIRMVRLDHQGFSL